MIISKSHFRISFCGGGTDFKQYFEQSYGNVISTTIDKAIFVTVHKNFEGHLFLRYKKKEMVNHVDELEHDMVKAILKMFGIETGIEIAIISEIPSHGSGLGSSSALASALIQAISLYQGKVIYRKELAEKTCKLEIDIMKKPIGFQDQYAICYGGINKIHFDKSTIAVNSINNHFYNDMVRHLDNISMLFYLGNGRKSEHILESHVDNIESKRLVLNRQRDLVAKMISCINTKQYNDKVGALVSESWEYKKQVTPNATNENIDNIIRSALLNGASGAKLCGAGAGGFMLVICEQNKQMMLREAMQELGLQELKFNFSNEGTKVIYCDN